MRERREVDVMVVEYSRKEAVQAAKWLVEDAADGMGRKWLVASVSSYGNGDYRTSVHILEGSPTRGTVVDLSEGRNHGKVVAFDLCGEMLGRFEYTP
jgi:hypothetical protein